MWILASAHSTSVPFIQILPVPGNPAAIYYSREKRNTAVQARRAANKCWPLLLFLIAKGAPVGPRVQRFAAMPAESRRRRLACPQPALDALGVVAPSPSATHWTGHRPGLGRPRAVPRGKHIL